MEGKPVTKDVEHWRKVRVVSAPISPSAYGYGENGKRAAHQDYRYYKYYGASDCARCFALGVPSFVAWCHASLRFPWLA